MQLSTMRRIDPLVGQPHCFPLGSRASCVDRLGGASHPKPPRRVLSVKLSEMDCTTIAVPAIQRTRILFEQGLRLTAFNHRKSSFTDNACFQEIKVQQVFEAAGSLMDDPSLRA